MWDPVVAPKQNGRARAGRNPAPLVVVLGWGVVQQQLAAVSFAPTFIQVHNCGDAAAVAVVAISLVAMVVAVPHVASAATGIMRHLEQEKSSLDSDNRPL